MASRRTADSRARMRPAEPPEFAVRRPRLERLLDEGAVRRMTLVAAPAGYGKSVLLAQWGHTRRSATLSWLTIDDHDRDPSRLGAGLIDSLTAIRPGIGQQALATLSGASTSLGDEFIELLLDDLESVEDDVAVVLDDFDRLDGPCVDDLGRLIMQAPRHVHFVVACRSDPRIPAHRLRSRGELVEPRVGDLRFTAAEARAVTEAVSGHRLNDDEAAHLIDLTEGWPVAVELAALSLRGAEDTSALIRFAGTDRTIVDYLSAEVLEQESPQRRGFLLDVSVLEEVNGELADAITGAVDGARSLEALEQQGLFVTPVPGELGWYRLHRLVRELLRHDLRSSDPVRPALLLGRAADWWLDRGAPGSAATCLIEARAWERLVELVYAQAQAEWDRGTASSVLEWIEAIPESVRRPSARLRLTQAALDLIVGRVARAAAAVVELEHELVLAPGEQLVADMVMCSLVITAGPQDDVLVRAERAMAAAGEIVDLDVPNVLLEWDVHSVRCIAMASSAAAHLMLGDGAALKDAERSLGSPAETAAVCRVLALGTAALVNALAGRTATAAGSAQLAAEIAGDTLSAGHPATLFSTSALAIAARLRGELAEAATRAGEALAIAIRWKRWPLVALLLAEEALIELSRGNAEAAVARLRDRSRYPMPSAGPVIEGRLRSVELRAGLVIDGDAASPLPDAGSSGASWELAAATVTAAVASNQVDQARKHLDAWPALAAPFGEVERELCEALVERAEGADREARARLVALLRRTEREGVVGPFVDAGEPALALLEEVAREHRGAHLDLVLDRVRRARASQVTLVDPLSTRELEVLQYLPTRMGNAEIAEALFVSTNTIKTHVKHIYQKLAATDRDDAVRIASETGLL